MKLLLFGASGMLGFAVHRVLHDRGYDVTGVLRSDKGPDSQWCGGLEYLHNVDAENFQDVMRVIERARADVVINAAGVKSVSSTPGDVRRLYAVNSVFPRLLDFAARSLGYYLIHFSTDGVFSGRRGMYTESSLPDATDPYGTSKFLGEALGERALVLRTSIIGRGISPNDSLLDWLLRQSGAVRGFRRAVFSGLPVNEIANVLAVRVLPRPTPLTGLFHLSAEPISKCDLLDLVRATWSLDQIQISADDSYVVDRSLDSSLLRKEIEYVPAAWEQLLAEMRTFYRGLDGKV